MPAVWFLAWPLLALSMVARRPVDTDDFAYRVELVNAIEDVADDGHEARLLLSLAQHESNFVRGVGECTDPRRLKTGAGALGAFQIIPRANGGDERRRACIVTFAALLARDRVRESLTACARNEKEHRLAGYTGGKCDGEEAQRLSRIRWVD